MPLVRKRHVLAVVCSDLHLSVKVPLARSTEPNWYAAMERVLTELKSLAYKHSVNIICAGDVFDKWNAPAELINFALEKLPPMYAIPGQHDLPYHNYEDMHKSAFGTLVKAGHIKLMRPEQPWLIHSGKKSFYAYGVPWGYAIPPISQGDRNHLNLAVVHRYIWEGENKYEGALETAHVSIALKNALSGFTAAVFGDNHKGFYVEVDGKSIFNCGTLMRRKIDEIKYKPRVGLLLDDGTFEEVFLDRSQDCFLSKQEVEVLESSHFNIKKFVRELDKLGVSSLDFKEAMEAYLKTYQVTEGSRRIILHSMYHHA